MISNFNIFYQNINGLKTKINDFKLSVPTINADCFAVTETWLNDNISSGELFDLEVFSIHRKDRDLSTTGRKDGGGVLLAVKKCYVTERLDKFEAKGLESLWVKIYTSRNAFIFVCVVYFVPESPKTNYKLFFDYLEKYEQLLSGPVFIIGDFNLRLLSKHWLNNDPVVLPPLEDYVARKIAYFNLLQHNSVLNVNNYCLDFVFTDLYHCKVHQSEFQLVPPDSHHPCLDISFQLFKCTKKAQSAYETYNFSKADNENVYKKLAEIDWSFLYVVSDIDLAVSYFYNSIYNVLDQMVPKTKPRVKKYPKWYTPEILKKLKLKEKLWKKYKKTSLLSDYENFSSTRSAVKKDIKRAYSLYNIDKEAQIKNEPNSFWKFINEKRKNDQNNSVLFYDNSPKVSDEEKCYAFAEYFASVYSEEKPNINLEEILKSPTDERVTKFLNITEITYDDILQAFKKLKPKFSKGIDGLPQYWVKAHRDIFMEPLHYILNLSLSQCKFPSQWKVASVIPIPKKPQTKLITEFRPISILCSFCKLYESVLYSKIFAHMEPYFTSFQYGFMPKKSTGTNLVNFTTELYTAIEEQSQVDVAYTDFQKCFDKVEFYVALLKLKFYGLSDPLVKLFHSYLTYRFQHILYNNCKSNDFVLNSSVPQGSNLGPLLFLIVVNDLPEVVKYSESFLFADDFKCSKKINSESDSLKLQEDLDAVCKWAKDNRLEFNIRKCSVMTYTLKTQPVYYEYKMNGIALERQRECKDLGIIFDPKLNFDLHIQKKVKEASRMLGFIKRVSSSFKSVNTLIILYNAFVRSKIEYNSIIWNPYQSTKISLLENVQKKFVKFLAMKFKLADLTQKSYNELLSIFKMTSLAKRREIIDLTYLFKLLKGKENNDYLRERVKFNVPQRSTRNRSLFHVPKCRISMTKNAPLNRMSRTANVHNEVDFFNDSFNAFLNKIK